MAFDAQMLLQVAQAAGVPEEDAAKAVGAALEAAYYTQPSALPGVTAHVVVGSNDVELRAENGELVRLTDLGTRGAAAARQAIVAWLRDVERVRKVGPWADLENTPIQCVVRKVLPNGDVRLDADGVTAVLPAGEAVPGESLAPGHNITVLLLAANVTDRDEVKLTVSRRQPALVSALFERHLSRTDTRIVSVAREPGVRVKVAYVGALSDLVGPAGSTVRSVSAELAGDKVDLVEHTADVATFAAAALTPARYETVEVTDAQRRAVRVTLTAQERVVAEGAGGVNLRLATKLSGARIELATAL